MGVPRPSDLVRFGPYELPDTQELLKDGLRLKLTPQAFRVLRLLLENPGQMVSREELHQALWPVDTFVDFDHGLNNAIKRIRDVLVDSADTQVYIETLPRLGYRFIASVERPGSSPRSIRSGPLPVTLMERGMARAGAAKWHKIAVAPGLVAAIHGAGGRGLRPIFTVEGQARRTV